MCLFSVLYAGTAHLICDVQLPFSGRRASALAADYWRDEADGMEDFAVAVWLHPANYPPRRLIRRSRRASLRSLSRRPKRLGGASIWFRKPLASVPQPNCRRLPHLAQTHEVAAVRAVRHSLLGMPQLPHLRRGQFSTQVPTSMNAFGWRVASGFVTRFRAPAVSQVPSIPFTRALTPGASMLSVRASAIA